MRHVEIGIPLKLVVDQPNWQARHYYDLHSLTAVTSLKSVTLYLDTAGSQGGSMYRWMMRRRKEGKIQLHSERVIAVFEEGWGLRTWLEEGFRLRGLTVDVRCVLQNMERYLGLLSSSNRNAKDEKRSCRAASAGP